MTSFQKSFSILDRYIGLNKPVYIIAEAGVAHFGDENRAMQLVDLAAEGGADAFKTQAFSTDSLISPALPEWQSRLRSKEVSFEFIKKMKDRCDSHGLTFLCTAHDESVLSWLIELNVAAIKVGSGERGNFPFLSKLAALGKPIILSTGMYEESHLTDTISFLSSFGVSDLAILHCVTSYPTPIKQLNLRALDRISELFSGPVGYSDHTSGFDASLAAVARGASIIEKHITVDFNVPNAQDWKVSCGPDDFRDFVSSIRKTEAMLGDAILQLQECEKPALHWALKSVAASKNLAAGSVIDTSMLVTMRPGSGLSPSSIDTLLGKVLSKDLKKGDLLTPDVFCDF